MLPSIHQLSKTTNALFSQKNLVDLGGKSRSFSTATKGLISKNTQRYFDAIIQDSGNLGYIVGSLTGGVLGFEYGYNNFARIPKEIKQNMQSKDYACYGILIGASTITGAVVGQVPGMAVGMSLPPLIYAGLPAFAIYTVANMKNSQS